MRQNKKKPIQEIIKPKKQINEPIQKQEDVKPKQQISETTVEQGSTVIEPKRSFGETNKYTHRYSHINFFK